MPADIVATTLLPDRMQESITLMDDYGSVHKLYVNVAQTAQRASIISSAQADMNARQAQLEHYAALNGHDLAKHHLANLAAKQARLKGGK